MARKTTEKPRRTSPGAAAPPPALAGAAGSRGRDQAVAPPDDGHGARDRGRRVRHAGHVAGECRGRRRRDWLGGLGRRRRRADRRTAGRPGDERADRDGRRAHARGARAREVPGAAVDQGSGIRSRDGQDFRRRLHRGGGQASRARGGAAAATRRRPLRLPRAHRAGALDARGARPRAAPPAAGSPVAPAVPSGTCPACGVANDADARFCKSCGARIEAA